VAEAIDARMSEWYEEEKRKVNASSALSEGSRVCYVEAINSSLERAESVFVLLNNCSYWQGKERRTV
jgi:hypothetical protein